MSTDTSPRPLADPTRTLIDEYLAEQQRLQTPVRRFADAHSREGQVLEPVWRELIPLSAPGPGEQYAFEVDLDRCTGCKACVAGCHSLNGLDDEETWRDVGLVLGGTRSAPYQQTITTACHHCEDPGCLNGCPVLAYEKDPVTGIVRHLDDQCIGCQYCVLKCPYDVPKYSERLGIVRKCDMCHHRLGAGEAPACVQACPTEAIRIVTVKTASPTDTQAGRAPATPVATPLPLSTGGFLSVAPDPSYTRPTTRYVSARTQPTNTAPADAEVLRPQPPHWPLIVMLTLMPMAVACLALDALPGETPALLPVAGWAAAFAGLAASVFHLGQPLRAWRVFLGLRRSWLSREAVLFGAWFPAATAYVVARVRPDLLPSTFLPYVGGLGIAVAAVGLVAVFCSVMIYVDTRRSLWRLGQTAPRFFLGGGVLGLATAAALDPRPLWAAGLALVLLAKLAVETRCLRALDTDEVPTPDGQSAAMMTLLFRPVLSFRYLSALALVGFSAAITAGEVWNQAGSVMLALAFLSELAERYLYFRAVHAPKMPGVITV